jgi:hypothetical protein
MLFSGVPPTAVGPGGGAPIAWASYLPPSPVSPTPSQSVLTYFSSVTPSPPYDRLIPPLIDSLVQESEAYPYEPVAPSPLPLKVTGVPGDATGWTVYLREPNFTPGLTCTSNLPGRIVSNKASIVDHSAMLYTFVDDPSDDYVVISPPPGSAMPLSFAQALASTAQGYPKVSPPVTVSGTVLGGGTAVPATLHFIGTALYAVDADPCSTKLSLYLSYDVFVETSKDKPGAFQVSLPQGQYDVVIDPDPSSGLAKTIVENVTYPATCGGSTQIQNADFTLLDLVPVSGSVHIADHRPLATAQVVLTPSALFTAQLLSNDLGYGAADWPRPANTTTGADGSFTVQVDPDGTYDVTVRPVDGTSLPWIVNPGGAPVITSAITIADLFVPAPTPLSLTIHDFYEDPIAQAVVQAYAFTDCPTGSPQPCTGVALQIGEALTDATGTFEMVLTPVPFAATSP